MKIKIPKISIFKKYIKEIDRNMVENTKTTRKIHKEKRK